MNGIGNTFGRYWRFIVFVVAVFAIFWIVWVLRGVLLPFILGLVIAYIFLPIIRWIEKRLPRRGRWSQVKRVSLIIFIFLVTLGLAGSLVFYMVNTVVRSIATIIESAPDLLPSALETLREWSRSLQQILPPEVEQQFSQILQNAGTAVADALRAVFEKGIALVPSTVSFILGLAAMPVFLFFILKDWEKLSLAFYSSLPLWAIRHTRNIIGIIDEVLGRYIRAQLLLGLVVGILVYIGLLILRMPFAPALAAFAAVTELIPVIGPWISGTFGVIVALAVAPDRLIWVAVVYVSVQLLENNLLVPRIHGGYLQIHPAIAIMLLVLGAAFAGFWGLILAVPLTATIVRIYKYLRSTVAEEEEKAEAAVLPPEPPPAESSEPPDISSPNPP